MVEDNTIRVWTVALDAGPESADRWFNQLLSAEEQDRAGRFQAAHLRVDWITARAALRFALGRCLQVSPAQVTFRPPEPGGQPYAGSAKPVLSQNTGLSFNLSHTQGRALIAVSSLEVGVDVERHRSVEVEADLAGMARAVMSDEELALWRALSARDRARAFYHLWTRKESYIKATGLGMFSGLREITVPVWPYPLFEAEIVSDLSQSCPWMVRDLPIEPGYSASISWRAAESARPDDPLIPEVVVEALDPQAFG
jgi:4'-phosphopantetheinyl transferase